MSPKRWLIIFSILSILLIILLSSLNYIIDPYGYQTREDKYIINLSRINKPQILHSRINSEGDYYIVGTSRMMRVDPLYIEKLTNKKVHNINISGSTLAENYMVANYLKSKNKKFIYGFDAFSLNKTRLKHTEIQNRYKTYQKELNNLNNIFTQYFNIDLLSISLKHNKDRRKKVDFRSNYNEENKMIYNYSINDVDNEQGYDNQNKKKNFSNYKAYDKDDIIKLAKIGTKDDKFIIFPKHYYNYILFEKYQNINTQYLESIKTLVENTNAEVWSFYQINDLTKNMNNFDIYGWHFKPKIGEKIMEEVFTNKNKFGILLTKNNINQYIESIRKNIQIESNSNLFLKLQKD